LFLHTDPAVELIQLFLEALLPELLPGLQLRELIRSQYGFDLLESLLSQSDSLG
jgi:hypothetical protein